MWRGIQYILPVFLLLGAGCVIGNSMSKSVDLELPPEESNDARVEDFNEIEADVEGEGSANAEEAEDAPLLEGMFEVNVSEQDEAESDLPVLEISMKSGNFFFNPPLIEAKPGQEIQIMITENAGLHTFVIDALKLRQQLNDGKSFRFTAPQKIGDYPFYCDIGEHRQLGMEGVLRISE